MLTQERATQVQAEFAASHPRPVHLPADEFRAARDQVEQLAGDAGYRFVGERLKEAVFSSKGVIRG